MIWLIGCKGMLGSDFKSRMDHDKLEYFETDVEVDITDISQLRKYSQSKDIDWIINCSAYTAVDKAEDEPDSASQINSDGVRNIAIIAKEKNAVLIHFSTDYVFDGTSYIPYNEEDITSPVNIYGASKLHGEINIQKELVKYFIFRISWLYGEHGKNFVYTMLRLLNENEKVRVVNDQWGSPTYTNDLVNLIVSLVNTESNCYGLYNFSCNGRITWYEFANEILKTGKKYNLINNDPVLEGISSAEYTTRAKRPMSSYLSKEKVIKNLGWKIPEWKDSLESFLAGLK